jgi:hypothetical protein
MLDEKLLHNVDQLLTPEELEHVTLHFDFNLDADNSLFEMLTDDVPVDPRELIPHLIETHERVTLGDIVKDWLHENARKKETYIYLAVFAMFISVFGRITRDFILTDYVAMEQMPEMMTPPPEPTPPPPPLEDTPEPTPPPEEEPEPMPTPMPQDRMEQRLDDMQDDRQLKELKIDEPKRDLAQDMRDSQLNAVKDSDNSVGSISRQFANTSGRASDNSNVNLSNVGRRPKQGDTTGTRSLGNLKTGRSQVRDSGATKSLGDVTGGRAKPTGNGNGGGMTADWIKLPSTGPVAHLQPRCQGRTGYVVVGKYRLQCGNDQIQAAWIRKQ